MPHNLYLHSSVVQTRVSGDDEASRSEAVRYAQFDIIAALLAATFVNAAILIVAASAFNANGHTGVREIEDAYRLLVPATGAAIAAPLFGIALLASGQSATFTGTIAGQVILEGFLDLKIPCWVRRLITRGLALVPALAGVLLLGDGAVGRLLVLTQVVLSAGLPFAMAPLLLLTADRKLMGRFASPIWLQAIGWLLFAGISGANVWLVSSLFG